MKRVFLFLTILFVALTSFSQVTLTVGPSSTQSRKVDSVWRVAGQALTYFSINGTTYSIKDSVGGGGGGTAKLTTITNQSIVNTGTITIDLTPYTGYNQIVIKAFGITTNTSTNNIKFTTSADNSSYSGTYVQGGTFGSDGVILSNLGNLSTDNDFFELTIQRPEITTMWPRIRVRAGGQDSGNNSVSGESSVAKGTAEAVRYVRLNQSSTTATTTIPVIEIWGY